MRCDWSSARITAVWCRSALAGAAFLVLADSFARTVMAPLEIPIGVITAFLGGPFFLFLLRRRTFSVRS